MRLTDTGDINPSHWGRLRRHAQKRGIPDADRLGMWQCKVSEVHDEGDRRDIVVYATTSDVDLDRDVVMPEGVDKSYFETNAAVFVDHSTDFDDQCGVVRSIAPYRKDGVLKGWKVTFRCLPEPRGEQVWQRFKNLRDAGSSGAVSIGFSVEEASPPDESEKKAHPSAQMMIRRWNWIELSAVSLPANARARVVLEPVEVVQRRFILPEEAFVGGAIELSA